MGGHSAAFLPQRRVARVLGRVFVLLVPLNAQSSSCNAHRYRKDRVDEPSLFLDAVLPELLVEAYLFISHG